MSAEVVDLIYALDGESVALDYADRLCLEVQAGLPWLADELLAAIHPLAGVSAGDRELYLTRRARLVLRLPATRVEDARALCGRRIDLGGAVAVGAATTRALAPSKTLYSAFVTVGTAAEGEFLAVCEKQLATGGIGAQLVCGKAQFGHGTDRDWRGFSLMLFGLKAEDSLRMQREGLGSERKRGCGIFVPHKSVAPVGE
ncbi:MAG TPA: type I-MYXAN CRISPR-associated protein Cas6/Cmx6 [Rhodocyclaceae bacterium]|nr:type I-MYXAN CRISPR-associated protein Cas6/Cmx6 [Rhodocyclaceae bacterium]